MKLYEIARRIRRILDDEEKGSISAEGMRDELVILCDELDVS